MLDAVMIAFLFLSALCVVLVLADEIRASLSRLRARGSCPKGAMNGEPFLAYIEQCLAPTLQRGDIVVPTTCPSTRSLVSRRPSGLLAQPSVTCRSTLRTLTPSSWFSIL
jgi:hypothetical protein